MISVEQDKQPKKEKKPRKPINKKAFIIHTLRKASYRWPARNECLKNSKKGRNQYLCKQCPDIRIYGRKDVQVDHIEPIVRLTGFVSFDDFIERLFCDVSGLQLLCKRHHKEKTDAEREIRKRYRKLKKETE